MQKEIITNNNFERLIEWQDQLAKNKDKWIYRGEKYDDDETKSLKTTIEKAFERLGGHTPEHKRDAEKDIIREFQRKLHLYTNNSPARPDILQWLALMQHHGAPTRLLDWTYSFWIAVHFAVERCEPEKKVALWAVNATEIVHEHERKKTDFEQHHSYKKILEKINRLNDLPYCDTDAILDNALTLLLYKYPKSKVFPSSSFRRNQRLTLQQGTFLIMGDVAESFQNNLYATLNRNNEKHIQLRVIVVDRDLKKRMLKILRQMNINNAVLFPGLDGFCESLWTRVGLTLVDKLLVGSKDLNLY